MCLQVRSEDKALSKRLGDLTEHWNTNKPLHGQSTPTTRSRGGIQPLGHAHPSPSLLPPLFSM